MSRRHALLLGLLLGLLSAGQAEAGVGEVAVPYRDPVSARSARELARDLVSEDGSKRLLAVRALRRRVRAEVRAAGRGDGSFSQLEARAALQEFDDVVAPRCIEALEHDNTAAGCADVLRMLETREALGPLERALEAHEKGRVRRRIQRALDAIRAAHGAAP